MSKWDSRFLALAQLVASWSKDPRTRVGCVIVRPDKTVASLGFNGLPRGVEDREDWLNNRLTKHKLIIHAEENAFLAARESLAGCTLYVWPLPPCSRCAAKIVQAGIARVVSPQLPADKVGDTSLDYELTGQLFENAGIEQILI
jgi:dCMP deaminase